MSEPWVAALRTQFQAIESRLGAPAQPGDREALKRDIIALFKRVDAALGDLGQMKEDIRGLVERYKQPRRRWPRRRNSPVPARRCTPIIWARRPTSRRAGA